MEALPPPGLTPVRASGLLRLTTLEKLGRKELTLQALILAGGLGTRLRGVLPDAPKPMAPISGTPFLEYLVLQLRHHGISEIVLSTGYLAEQIRDYFGDGSSLDVEIDYSHEESPMGTGGALKLADEKLTARNFMVMNGDSFLDLDISKLVGEHDRRSALVTMALTRVEDPKRYGSVVLDSSGRVDRLVENGVETGSALINAGIYVLNRSLLEKIHGGATPVSLEKDVFSKLMGAPFFGVVAEGFFIDIGIPKDYEYLDNNPQVLASAIGRE